MLRITTKVEPAATILKLEGRLAGDWVGELRRCYHDTAVPRCGVRVDLGAVEFVDKAGLELLREMAAEGVDLVADQPLMESVIAEVRKRNSLSSGK